MSGVDLAERQDGPRPVVYLTGLVILALLTWARVWMIDALPDQGYFAKYTIVADQILNGHMPRERLLDFSPLYLWFVVALRAIGAGFHAIRTLQIFMVSVAAALAAIAARRFGTIAVVAAPILVLGSRGALVCATEVEPETLILLLNAAAIVCLGSAVPWHRFGWWKKGSIESGGKPPHSEGAVRDLVAGVLLGLSAACRPVALLVVIALAIAMRSWRIVAGAIVPIIVILIVNYSLTRDVTLMDPGTVFYEGMNPSAAGYEGVQPRIVNDLERQSRDPDYLHVAYRLVAARALGHPVTRAESNRYWTGKALAFARAYPLAALTLAARKFYLALHSYEAYDLVTMARKDAFLPHALFIPFGILVGFALMAMLMRVRGIAPLVIFAGCIGITLVVFYVTARQRNAMLPAIAILAAAGIAEMVRQRTAGHAAAAIIIGVLLSINGPPQREDLAGWLGIRNAFDESIALEQQGRWSDADSLLARLEDSGYRPMRENRAVSSIAYYRAIAAAHLGRDPRPLLAQAEIEAPGNEHVLAALADLGDRRAEGLLYELHDPFTARRSLLAARQKGM